MKLKTDVPFFLDFAFELPEGVEIESACQARDCVTYDGVVTGCDDD